jgi:hypothetical protein
MDHKCQYCSSSFKNKYNLKKHIDEGKKCLKLRNIKCKSCLTIFSNQNELEQHLVICKDHIITQLKEELFKKDTELKEELFKKDTELKEELFKKDIEINKLHEKIESILSRPSTINNTQNINLSTTYTLDSIEEEHLVALFKENLTSQIFMSGQQGLAKLCTDKIINTKDNKKLICCTDFSRKKFKYIDKSGNTKEDIEARNFVKRVGKPMKDAGKVVYDDMMSSLRHQQDCIRPEEYGKKENLISQSIDVMNKYTDIINVDDPNHNTRFTNELAILNKE